VILKLVTLLKLKDLPVGSFIHNVELKPGKGGQLGRTAGVAIQLMAKEGKYAQLKMPSGEVRMISLNVWQHMVVGNSSHENISLVKLVDQDGWVKDLLFVVLQ
jgi:large subunit ribosomal protein L2